MTLNMIITEDDIRSSEKLKSKEYITPLNSDNLFRGAVYTMLATKERYTRQVAMYNKLLLRGLDNPDAILQKHLDVATIVKGLGKTDYLMNLSRWWLKSYIAADIIADINNGRKDEFNIRNRIAKDKDASGLSYKGASLFLNMCGYVNVVALDIWTLRALVAEDYMIKSYKYIPQNGKKNSKHNYLGKGKYIDRGITGDKEYTLYEEFFRDLTSRYNAKFNHTFTPFDFRQILWVKRSAWGKEFGNDVNQLEIKF
ncbi:MAG: hypothetical protein ACP5NW_01945 [Candidatus Woesearchaeota archaeon]